MAILVTDILKNGSYLLYNKKSEHIFKESLEQEIEEGIFLEGIVSRKKQIVPRIMNYIEKK